MVRSDNFAFIGAEADEEKSAAFLGAIIVQQVD